MEKDAPQATRVVLHHDRGLPGAERRGYTNFATGRSDSSPFRDDSESPMSNYVVTVTAADRVGIVESVTGTVLAEGGNVLELSQTVMRGFFTIILAVEFPE